MATLATATNTSDIQLSLNEARQIALRAQGFAVAHKGGDAARLRSVLDHIGVLQIDSVNVLVRSQELPLFARLGAHDRKVIASSMSRGRLFEYWVHEASLAPVELHPYLRWRMQRSGWVGNNDTKNRSLAEQIYRKVRDDGPLKAADISTRVGKKGTWWDWDESKMALEHLFYAGRITTRPRDNDFARVYDLVERVIPSRILQLPTPSELDARRELLRQAAAHLGVGTMTDLVDYHRQKPKDAKAALQSLVEDGELRTVRVAGWKDLAYLPKRVRSSKPVSTCALLSPFDSLVWNRDRNERLFNFHYRIEIYTPKPKRRFGYYVLPVLCGDTLVGRLDMKADRAARTLRVQGSYLEPGIVAKNVVEPIARQLSQMARWLSLEQVAVGRRGTLATKLASAMRAHGK